VELFVEEGSRARIATVRLDVIPAGEGGDSWRILAQERLGAIEGLYHLALNPDRQ
jgi:hypothetical protein